MVESQHYSCDKFFERLKKLSIFASKIMLASVNDVLITFGIPLLYGTHSVYALRTTLLQAKDIAQNNRRKIFIAKGPELSGTDFFTLPPLGHTGALGLYRSVTTTCVHLKLEIQICSRWRELL